MTQAREVLTATVRQTTPGLSGIGAAAKAAAERGAASKASVERFWGAANAAATVTQLHEVLTRHPGDTNDPELRTRCVEALMTAHQELVGRYLSGMGMPVEQGAPMAKANRIVAAALAQYWPRAPLSDGVPDLDIQAIDQMFQAIHCHIDGLPTPEYAQGNPASERLLAIDSAAMRIRGVIEEIDGSLKGAGVKEGGRRFFLGADPVEAANALLAHTVDLADRRARALSMELPKEERNTLSLTAFLSALHGAVGLTESALRGMYPQFRREYNALLAANDRFRHGAASEDDKTLIRSLGGESKSSPLGILVARVMGRIEEIIRDIVPNLDAVAEADEEGAARGLQPGR